MTAFIQKTACFCSDMCNFDSKKFHLHKYSILTESKCIFSSRGLNNEEKNTAVCYRIPDNGGAAFFVARYCQKRFEAKRQRTADKPGSACRKHETICKRQPIG